FGHDPIVIAGILYALRRRSSIAPGMVKKPVHRHILTMRTSHLHERVVGCECWAAGCPAFMIDEGNHGISEIGMRRHARRRRWFSRCRDTCCTACCTRLLTTHQKQCEHDPAVSPFQTIAVRHDLSSWERGEQLVCLRSAAAIRFSLSPHRKMYT